MYGTLKPGEANYDALFTGHEVFCTPAITQGKLYSLPFGYPAMTTGEDWVQGILLTFKAPVLLDALDELEDYKSNRPADENEYQRQIRPIYTISHQPLTHAWVYLMLSTQIQRWGGQYLASGHWTGAAATNNP